MTPAYVARRVGVFFLVVVVAVSINFFIPRLRSTNPVEARMNEFAQQGGGNAANMKQLIAIYNEKFGLDKPLWQQYLNYWADVAHFDLGTSVAFYPGSVRDEILRAAPWTIGLLGVATLVAFLVGPVLGALLAWPNTGRLFSIFVPVLMTLSAIPYYLLGLLLIYILALVWPVLPTAGGYSSGARLTLSWPLVIDILRHAILPACSIILAGIGFWGLGMRAMMITPMGEDYMTLAYAKGLRARTIFVRYSLRNALLPQITALAISLAGIIEQMGVISAAWAWMWPARTVRAQVLTIRERMHVQVARLNGMSWPKIILRELMPNLVPFLAASFVGTIAAAILASIGLSALGLGPQNQASLGLAIYWAIFYGALIRNLWWWFVPSVIITVILFVGLFLTTAGLDRIANPRLRTSA